MLQKRDLEKRLLAQNRQRASHWRDGRNSRVHESKQQTHERAVAMAQAALRVRPQPNTRLVEVTFDSSDPRISADLANSLISAYSEISFENRWRSIESTSQWLTRQVQDVKTKLEKSQDALQTYARASGLTFLSAGAENTTSEERLRQLELELSSSSFHDRRFYKKTLKADVLQLPKSESCNPSNCT